MAMDPVFQKIGPVGNFQTLVGVLLNQQNRNPLLINLLYDLEDLRNQQGGQTQ